MQRSIYFMLLEWKKKTSSRLRLLFFLLWKGKGSGCREIWRTKWIGSKSKRRSPFSSPRALAFLWKSWFWLSFLLEIHPARNFSKGQLHKAGTLWRKERDLSSRGGKCVCHGASTEQRLRGAVVVGGWGGGEPGAQQPVFKVRLCHSPAV